MVYYEWESLSERGMFVNYHIVPFKLQKTYYFIIYVKFYVLKNIRKDSLKYDLKMSILESNKKNSLKYQMISIVMYIPWKSFKYNKFSKYDLFFIPSIIIRNHSNM